MCFIDIQDDEYAIYSVNRQRIQYIVEFAMPDDNPVPLKQPVVTSSDIFVIEPEGSQTAEGT